MKHKLALTAFSEVVNISITILSDFCSLTLPFLLFISAVIILLYGQNLWSYFHSFQDTHHRLCALIQNM